MDGLGGLFKEERVLLIKVHKLLKNGNSVEEISKRLNISIDELKVIINEINMTEV